MLQVRILIDRYVICGGMKEGAGEKGHMSTACLVGYIW
jgi:hypothetical protein